MFYEITDRLVEWRKEHKKIAMATVVKTWGSAPRPLGSKMIVEESGVFEGSVSGGCVETAIIDRAGEVMQTAKPVYLTYGVSRDDAWSVGLSCGGTLDVLLEPVLAEDPVFTALLGCLHEKRRAVLITAVQHEGEECGIHRLLLTADEATGALPQAVHSLLSDQREELLQTRTPEWRELSGNNLFIEPVLPPPRLIVVGGVHVAIPLTQMAPELGFEVVLVDPRESFASPERFPHLRNIVHVWPDEALHNLRPDANSFVVILSHDAKLDDPAIIASVEHGAAYIGVLGSRRTHARRVERLRQAGLTEEQISGLHAPVGLDIAARTPAEVAVSILAEITAVMRGGDE